MLKLQQVCTVNFLWLVSFVLGSGVSTNQCTGLSWNKSYLWLLSVLAYLLTCAQMLGLPRRLWCNCIWGTNCRRCFKMCADHNLLPEGRMSYSELFLMLAFFFFQIHLKLQSSEGGVEIRTCWHLLAFVLDLVSDVNNYNSICLTEPFSACLFCHELCPTALCPERSQKLSKSAVTALFKCYSTCFYLHYETV